MNLIRLAIARPIFVTMIMLFLVVLGTLALFKLPVDLYPSVAYPVMAVRADLPGAAPEEVEQLVTKRMEEALSTLPGLVNLRSSSRPGTAMVMMEFDIGTDIRFQEIQVRGKIGNLKRRLPDNLSDPVVYRMDPDDTPIIEIAITTNKSAAEISKFADIEIANALRQINGVGAVNLSGTRSEEVRVELKPEALDAWRINAKDVVAAIARFNRNESVGNLEGKDRIWFLRLVSKANITHELGSIPISQTATGQPVFLRDVANIQDGFAAIDNIVLFGDHKDLTPAVLLRVQKQSGENTVGVSDRVRKALKEIEKNLPSDIKVTITRDNADLVRSNVADVYETLIIGAVLTVLVVLVFLRSPRATFTTGLSLPSSVITTFAIMAVAGFTINIMTLLGLSLAIGLLVDDAIVVRENIFRFLHKERMEPKKAAQKGASQVSLAVIATTLTIVAVFLPVGFMGGVSGQFFKQFALTVVFAVLVSLWDAMTMAPMLSAYYANIPETHEEWKGWGKWGVSFHNILERFDNRFDSLADAYKKVLEYLLPRPWIAPLILVVSLVIAAVGFIIVPKSFLPTQLGSSFTVMVGGPIATTPARAFEVGYEMERRLHTVKGIDNWTVYAGTNASGAIDIDMMVRVAGQFADSQKDLAKIRSDVRQALSGYPGTSVRISEPADPLAGAGGRFQPLAVMISGSEISEIMNVARSVRAIMAETPGVTDVAPLQDEGLPEVQFKVDNELAAHYGISAQAIAETLSIWVLGDTSNSLKIGDDQIPIRVSLKDGMQMTPSDLLLNNYYFRPAGAKSDIALPIGNVVKPQAGAGPTSINRENRQRIMRVGANITAGAALGDVVAQLNEKLKQLPLPKGYTVKIAGQNEQMAELFKNVLIALLLGAVFVYMILASLFESLLHPISVMIAIPLAATGAVLALLVTGKSVDLYAGISMVLLAGIVAKNSILLVDFAIQRVAQLGEEPEHAICSSAPIRLRPILMTSIAIIFGMIPVALGVGSGGAARQALGIATIGGVISSTLLTLFVVPNLYVAIESFRAYVLRRKAA
jgi:HAE1 family hydrophobic/amphiphilic exporter-1